MSRPSFSSLLASIFFMILLPTLSPSPFRQDNSLEYVRGARRSAICHNLVVSILERYPLAAYGSPFYDTVVRDPSLYPVMDQIDGVFELGKQKCHAAMLCLDERQGECGSVEELACSVARELKALPVAGTAGEVECGLRFAVDMNLLKKPEYLFEGTAEEFAAKVVAGHGGIMRWPEYWRGL